MAAKHPADVDADAQLEARRRAQARTAYQAAPTESAFQAFGRRYHDDWPAFVADCVMWPEGRGLAPYQEEILAELPVRKRIAPRGPHALGKTAAAALAILAFALTREALGRDWKIPTTAGAWRQLTKYLWPEVHKWARKLRWDKIGRGPLDPHVELLATSLKLEHGEAFALASSDAELLEGAHADSLFYVLDESKAIPDPTWDAVEGAFASAGEHGTEALALAISTPGSPSGRFYDIHKRKPGFEDWWPRHVTLEEAIAAKRVTREWAEQRRRQWGETSAVYQNRVLGEFAAQSEDGVIPLAWVEAANERWLDRQDRITAGLEQLPPLERLAVDLAWGGEDHTTLASKHGPYVAPLERFTWADTMTTVGVLVGRLRGNRKAFVRIEITGAAGVYDRTHEQLGGQVEAFVPSGKSEAHDRSGELGFVNQRAEAWWGLREQLDPSFAPTLELPPDDQLTGDLTAPKWKVLSNGRIQIQEKDELRKAPPDGIGRSPDDGDAVVILCLRPSTLYEFITPNISSTNTRRAVPGVDIPDHSDDNRGEGRGLFGRAGKFGPGAW